MKTKRCRKGGDARIRVDMARLLLLVSLALVAFCGATPPAAAPAAPPALPLFTVVPESTARVLPGPPVLATLWFPCGAPTGRRWVSPCDSSAPRRFKVGVTTGLFPRLLVPTPRPTCCSRRCCGWCWDCWLPAVVCGCRRRVVLRIGAGRIERNNLHPGCCNRCCSAS